MELDEETMEEIFKVSWFIILYQILTLGGMYLKRIFCSNAYESVFDTLLMLSYAMWSTLS